MSKENPSSLAYTTPLFIQHQFLASGHDIGTDSATGTFIKFENNIYIVTCDHVLKQANHLERMNLAVVTNRTIFNLSEFQRDGYLMPSFRVPLEPCGMEKIDIGITKISNYMWSMLKNEKGKKSVDLDDWKEPAWSKTTNAKACGWLNGEKDEINEKLAVKGVEILADIASKLSPNERQFTMHSPTDNSENPSLSGVSGGIIVANQDQEEIPFGVIFEGYPNNNTTSNLHEAYLKQGDLMIRGHILTPEIFKNWLNDLD